MNELDRNGEQADDLEGDFPNTRNESEFTINENRIPISAVLRPAENPLKRTIWQVSRYNTCIGLMERRFGHRHDKISKSNNKDDRYDAKSDPNRWSQI